MLLSDPGAVASLDGARHRRQQLQQRRRRGQEQEQEQGHDGRRRRLQHAAALDDAEGVRAAAAKGLGGNENGEGEGDEAEAAAARRRVPDAQILCAAVMGLASPETIAALLSPRRPGGGAGLDASATVPVSGETALHCAGVGAHRLSQTPIQSE